MDQLRAEGNIIGGPAHPFDTFKAGWAHGFPGTDKCHYYREINTDAVPLISRHGRVRVYESICHHRSFATRAAGMFEPGNWPRCTKCQRVVDRRGLK